MRIAQVAPLYEAVPPGAYGGTERVIATLCDGLVAMGHEVTLFAPETSETDAVLEAYGEPLRTRFSREELTDLAPHLHLQMLAELYARQHEFDVVHSHLDIWTYPFTLLSQVPTVLTMHGRLDLDFLRDLLPRYGGVPGGSPVDGRDDPRDDHGGERGGRAGGHQLDLPAGDGHPHAAEVTQVVVDQAVGRA